MVSFVVQVTFDRLSYLLVLLKIKGAASATPLFLFTFGNMLKVAQNKSQKLSNHQEE